MVVAVENGLGEVSKQLRERGYIIVSYPEYKGVVDAFIYKGEIPSALGSYQDDGLNQSLENYTQASPKGVLIVNATNKNVVQIEEILRTRIYSPLF